jgi:serine O-acetyltransferase
MSVFSNWLGVTPLAGVAYAPSAWTSTREETRWLIRSDLYRYFGRADWRAALYAFMRIPGFRFTVFLRKATYHSAQPGPLHRLAFWINWLILQHYGFKYGFQIPYTTQVGAGLLIYHHGTLLVNAQAVLGDNVNLSPGVIIGQSNRGKHAGAPVIGNRVWIGCNAAIVGAVTIGDDAMIAPGAYVNFDVPAKAVVIGNPGQITSYSGSESYTANLASEITLAH